MFRIFIKRLRRPSSVAKETGTSFEGKVMQEELFQKETMGLLGRAGRGSVRLALESLSTRTPRSRERETSSWAREAMASGAS